MATITLNNTFTAGTKAKSSEVNDNFSTIFNDYNGNINNDNIASNAAILFNKMAALTDGSIPFADSSGFLIEDNTNLKFNSTNNYIDTDGIGQKTSAVFDFFMGDTKVAELDTSSNWIIGGTGGSGTQFQIVNDTASDSALTLKGAASQSDDILIINDSTGSEKFAISIEGIVDYKGTMANSTKNPETDAEADWVEIKIAGVTHFLPAYVA